MMDLIPLLIALLLANFFLIAGIAVLRESRTHLIAPLIDYFPRPQSLLPRLLTLN